MRAKLVIIILLLINIRIIPQGFYETDWRAIIDSTWEQIYTVDEMLAIHDSVWNVINGEYACFQNLNVNWDSLRTVTRDEILDSVSYGRFVAILNHLGILLKESHTYIADAALNQNYKPKVNTPLIYQCGGNDFGAMLSPLPDSSLLVYSVDSDHPLGLELGDVILGYEHIPWNKMYKDLLKLEFPTGIVNIMGSNDESFNELWLMSTGNNWHLFDTIDIVKYNSLDTVHLPTNVLANKQYTYSSNRQLPVPGIPIPENIKQNPLAWGIVDNTHIGYIYVWNWFAIKTSNDFYNALDSLINIFNVDGLIIDIRQNTGGYFSSTDKGLNLLFKENPTPLGLAGRVDKNYRYLLSNSLTYYLNVDSTTFFDKPIAVLTSGHTISAGDFMAFRLKEHPHVKIFGSTPSGSYSSLTRKTIKNIILSYSYLNGFSLNANNEYLSHSSLDIDYKIYFTPEDILKGEDTIVKEALKWITNNINTNVITQSDDTFFELSQNYPNPFNANTIINYSIPKADEVSLIVYDILGKEILRLVDQYEELGTYTIKFDASNLASGIYYYVLRSGKYRNTKKLVLLK